MDALDRLDWPARLSVTSFGVRLTVRTNVAALLPKIQEHLPPGFTTTDADSGELLYSVRGGGPVAGSNVRRFNLVYSGIMPCARTLDEQAAFEIFESVVRFDVAALAQQFTFVHAGVVGWRGRAIVIPGASTHGKSTLVEALVRAGATYYSDEFAVIDELGRVHPFAKPLSLRLESGGVRRVPPAELGAIGEIPLLVGLIVATRYEQGAEWRPRRLQPGEALLALLAHSVRARLAPAQTMQALARVVEYGVTLSANRGEAGETARRVLSAADMQLTHARRMDVVRS